MTTGPLTDSLAETLSCFAGSEPLTTSDVAERLDVGRRSTYERLERLAESDMLRTKKVGASARVWWVDGEATTAAAASGPSTNGEAERAGDPPTNGEAEQGGDRSHESERDQQFRALVEATEEYAIFLLDPRGFVRTWNPGAERIKGYDREDVVGEHFSQFYTEEDCAAGVPEGNLATAAEEGAVEDEGWRRRADGSRFWANVTITAITDDDGDLTGFAKVTRDMTERRAYERKLEAQARRLARQRDELERELDDVFERVDDAFFAVDDDWRFTYANRTAAEYVRLSPAEMLGERVWDVLHEVAEGEPRAVAEQAMETGESAEFDFYSEMLETWFEVRLYPADDGLSVYFRDVDDRKERERELEQYETIVDTMRDGVYVLDEQFRFARVNDAYVEMTGYDREELLGAHCSLVVDDEVVDASADRLEEVLAGDGDAGTLEADVLRKDGSTLRAESRFTGLPDADGAGGRKIGVVRDVSERVARERELERFRRAVEASGHAIYMTDSDGRITDVNDAFEAMTGYAADDAVGETPAILHSGSHDGDYYADLWKTVHSGEVWEEEIADCREDGTEYVAEQTIAPVTDEEGQIDRFVAVQTDVTERKERERELEESRRRYQTLLENFPNGAVALVDEDLRYVTVGGTPVEDADTSPADFAGCHLEDVLPDDLAAALVPRYEAALAGEADSFELSTDAGVRQVRTVPVRDDEGSVFAAMGTSQDVTERKRREEELLHQREQLRAINSLDETVREVTAAVIDQSTREGVERAVCEHLAAQDSYEFAWIGDVDVATETIELRAEAGVDGYLDGVTVSVDPDDSRSDGPTGRAVRTREIQTTQDIRADERHDPWREHVEEYGFRSSAAIPVVHEETLYGVLNVYADRPDAFEGEERAVIDRLGEVVGHAIAATERKRALMSDEVVELDFHVDGFVDALGVDPVEGRAAVESVVPVTNDEYLAYGTATADAVEGFRAVVDAAPHWDEVTVHGADDAAGEDPVTFEIRLSEPPVLSALASMGGSIERAVVEDGDYDLTLHVSPGADVRGIIERMQEAYPSAEMLKRRQITRADDDPRRELLADLTDRQRAAVEAAYHAGFFDWPRESSGEDVAESLGVSSPTFHQHLRKAEGKVFDRLLD